MNFMKKSIIALLGVLFGVFFGGLVITFFSVIMLLLALLQTYIILDLVGLFQLTFIKLTFIQMFGCLAIIGLLRTKTKKDGESSITDLLKAFGGSFIGWLLTWGILYIFHWVLMNWH